MRSLTSLLAVIAASATASASASTVSLSIRTSADKVLYGHEQRLTGRLSTGLPGRPIAIYSKPYGLAMIRIATVRTGRDGRWSLEVGPAIGSTYMARAGTTMSPLVSIGVRPAIATHTSLSIAIGVEPRLTVRVLGDGRIAVHVAASKHLLGRMVQLQQLTPAHEWTTVGKLRLDRSANAVFGASALVASPPAGGTTLRVAMSVNQAGAGLLGASSHAFIYHSV